MAEKRKAGRPPKATRHEFILAWVATRNPYTDLDDIAREFGLTKNVVRRIQTGKYKYMNRILEEDLGLQPLRVDNFLKQAPHTCDPSRELGWQFNPSPCPPRYQLERLLQDMLRTADRGSTRIESEERYSATDMSADAYKKRA